MINKKIILAASVFVLLISCKKNYTCQCSNENGSYIAGETEGTKRQAKKYCASLAPSAATTCDIK